MQYISGDPVVEDISSDKIKNMLQDMFPIVRNACNEQCYLNIEGIDFYTQSFIWDKKERMGNIIKEKLKIAYIINFDSICAYYGLYKPSLNEVLSAIIPYEKFNIVAFEIDLESVRTYESGNGHCAKLILYKFA